MVAGGGHVKHQPPFLRGPDHSWVQQKQVRLPGRGEAGIICAITKDRSKPVLTQVTETRSGVMEWREGVRGVWRSGTKKERWSEEENEGGRLGGMEGSRWWGPGEHFIFLIDSNGFINGQSFHTPHTVHHWLEFCGRAKKSMGEIKKKKKQLQKTQKFWKV